jgi:hypothetical protein
MAVTIKYINGVPIVVVTRPTGTTTGTSSGSSNSSVVAQAASATAVENNAASSSVAASKSGPLSLSQINQLHKNIIANNKVSYIEENGKFYKVVNGQKYLDWSDPRNSQTRDANSTSSTWYDIDTALSNVYAQAAKLGVSVNKPSKTYGKSITSETEAQKILDSYVTQVNNQISSNYAKQVAASNKQSASNSKSGGGASAIKVGNLTTTTYDIAANVKNIQSTAKQYGVTLSGLSQTSFSSQSAAQKALDNYYNAAQKALNAKINSENVSAKAAAAWKPSTIPSSMKADYDSWNSEVQTKYGKTLNPDYFLWLKGGKAAINGAPKYYLEDAQKETDATRSARAAADAVKEAKFAASQKALQDSYNAMLIAKGTSSNTNRGNNAANIKSSSYSKGTPATFSNANNKINKITVVKAETKTDNNTKLQTGSNALAKYNNKLAVATVKSVTEKANKAASASGKSNFLGMGFKSSVIEVKDGKAALKLDDSKKLTTSDFKKFTPLYNNGAAVVSKGSNSNKDVVAVLEKTAKTSELMQNINGIYKTTSPVLYTNPSNGDIALIANKGSSNDFESLQQIADRVSGKPNKALSNESKAVGYITNSVSQIRQAAAGVTKSILPDLETAADTRDRYLSKIQISKHMTEKDVTDNLRNSIKGNVWGKGLADFTISEYNTLRNDPAKYTVEVAATAIAGEVIGAAAGGAKVATALGGAKVASKLANPTAKFAADYVGKHAVDAGLVGSMAGSIATEAVPYSKTATDVVNSRLGYSIKLKEFTSDTAANVFRGGKEFAIGGYGFSKGMGIGGRVTDKSISSIASTIENLKKVDAKYANARPSEFDVTRISAKSNTPIIKTQSDKVVTLKKRVSELSSSSKASDKATVKSLKRQINALESSKSNANAVKSFKSKNSSDIKALAEIKAFDKRMAELKEMKTVAESLDRPYKPKSLELTTKSTLNSLTKGERKTIDRIKTGGQEVLPEFKIVKSTSESGARVIRRVPVKSNTSINKGTVRNQSFEAVIDMVKSTSNLMKSKVKSMKELSPDEKITSLKYDIAKLQNSGKPSDQPKIKLLKRELYALENKGEKSNKVIQLRSKNYPEIKETAENQAFDRRLSELKEMREVADSLDAPYKGYSINERAALSLFSRAELNAIDAINSGKKFKSTPLTEADVKAAHAKAKERIKKEKEAVARSKRVEPSDRELKKLVELSKLKEIQHLKTKAVQIEKALEKARVEGNVSKEALLMAKKAKFHLENGISTEKAVRLRGTGKVTGDLGKKRAEYSRLKEIHERAGKFKQSQLDKRLPNDVTNVVGYREVKYGKPTPGSAIREESQRFMRDVTKWKKQQLDGVSDVTDVVGKRRITKPGPVRVTRSDIVKFNSMYGHKYNINKLTDWDSFKASATKFNEETAKKRAANELSAKRMQAIKDIEAADKVIEEALKPLSEKPHGKPLDDIHFDAWAEIQKKRTAKREAKLTHKASPEYQKLEETHYNRWEDIQRDKTAKREAVGDLYKSPEYQQNIETHYNRWEDLQRKKTAKRETRSALHQTAAYKKLQDTHYARWEDLQRKKTAKRETRRLRHESPEYKEQQEIHYKRWEDLQRKKTAKRETRAAKHASADYKEQAEYHFKRWQDLQKKKTAKREAKKAINVNDRLRTPLKYSKPEYSPARLASLEKAMSQMNERVKEIDLNKQHVLETEKSTRHEEDLNRAMVKANAQIESIDLNKQRILDARRIAKREKELTLALEKAKEYQKNVDLGKYSRMEIERYKKHADTLDRALIKANEELKHIDVNKHLTADDKRLASRTSALEAAVAKAKKWQEGVDLRKWDRIKDDQRSKHDAAAEKAASEKYEIWKKEQIKKEATAKEKKQKTIPHSEIQQLDKFNQSVKRFQKQGEELHKKYSEGGTAVRSGEQILMLKTVAVAKEKPVVKEKVVTKEKAPATKTQTAMRERELVKNKRQVKVKPAVKVAVREKSAKVEAKLMTKQKSKTKPKIRAPLSYVAAMSGARYIDGDGYDISGVKPKEQERNGVGNLSRSNINNVIRNLEQTINKLPTEVKPKTNSVTRPGIDSTHKIETPIKPKSGTPTRNDIPIKTHVPIDIKSKIIPVNSTAVVPVVSGVVVPVTEQTIVPVITPIIEDVMAAYQEGENQIAYLYMRRKKQQEALMKHRKPKSQKAINDGKRGNAKIKRTIFNRLGSIETMFGASKPKKTTKRIVKRAREA